MILSRVFILTSLSRMFAALGGLIFSVAVARLFGVDVLGAFVFTNAVILLATMVAKFGGDRTLTKYVAIFSAPTDAAERRLQLSRHYFTSTVISAVLVFCFLGWVAVSDPQNQPRVAALGIMCFALPFLSLMMLNSGYIKGLSLPYISTLFETGGLLALAAALVGLAAVLSLPLGLGTLATAYVCAAALAWGVSLALALTLERRARRSVSSHERQVADPNLRENLRFVFIDSTNFLMSSGAFIIGGLILADADLGLLRGAERITLLIAFVLSVTNAIIAPKIARQFSIQNFDQLRALGRWATSRNILVATPLLLLCIIFPDLLLGIFGEGFEDARHLVRIMAVGQLVNVLSGPCALFLTMTEHAKTALRINIISVAVSFGLYATFSYYWGTTGFATAYLLSLVFRNFAMLWAVKRMLGIFYLTGFSRG